jgi:hypothetical protein
VLIQRFGRSAYDLSAFPQIFDDTPEAQIATGVQTVAGDEASIRFQRGSNLKFIRVAGRWKFDFFRTTPVRPAQLRLFMTNRFPGLVEMKRLVEAGRFTNVDAAAEAFQNDR